MTKYDHCTVSCNIMFIISKAEERSISVPLKRVLGNMDHYSETRTA